LLRRLTDHGMRDFAAPADIFNLVFFMVAFGLAAILSQTIRASLVNPVDSLKYEE